MLIAHPSPADDGYQREFDRHTVHFNVFNSMILQPDVAATLGFDRGKNHFLINIAVVDSTQATAGGQPAHVSGTATNLLQQQQTLAFVPVREQNVEYYLAPLCSLNRDVWRFSIEVDPDGSGGPYRVEFQKTLYVD